MVNENAGEIRIFLTGSKTLVAIITAGIEPETVVLSPDGAIAMIPNETSHDVTVIDARDGTVLASVPVGENPRGVLPDGSRAYVAHGRSNDVWVIDTSSHAVVSKIPIEGKRVWWTALTPGGEKLYATAGRSNKVAVIETSTNKVIKMIEVGERPWGVAISH